MKLNIKGCRSYCEKHGIKNYVELADLLELSVIVIRLLEQGTVDKSARVAQYENSSLFKMPKGEFEGYTYHIPNGFVKENEEKGTLRIGLPEEFVVKPKDNVTGDEKSMTVEEFVEQVKNKKQEAYRYFKKPSEEAKA